MFGDTDKQQEEINAQLLQALKELMKAAKLQQEQLEALKDYIDKRDDFYDQTNRTIIGFLGDLKKLGKK